MTSRADPPRSPAPAATLVGLGLALLLPLLSNLVLPRLAGAAPSRALIATGIAIHWITFALLLVIVRRWERQPSASIGWRAPRAATVPLGIAAGILIVIAAGFLTRALNLQSDVKFVTFLQSLPLAWRVILVITAGVFEETAFRGYALERLAPYVGGRWAAAALTLVLFALAHASAVGTAHLPPILIVGGLVTLLYLWRRDLLLNMIAHSTIDAIGLIVVPALR